MLVHFFYCITFSLKFSFSKFYCRFRDFQYTDWENIKDGYANQNALGDLVGDYFFVCPTNLFANVFAEQGGNVYYYFFTQVSKYPALRAVSLKISLM